jgi:hypothetical protein
MEKSEWIKTQRAVRVWWDGIEFRAEQELEGKEEGQPFSQGGWPFFTPTEAAFA